MKIGDECYVHGYVDEIRNDTIIIRNEGGYFGTAKSEVLTAPAEYVRVVRCKDCKWYYRGGATCMFWDGANGMCGDDFCSRAERAERKEE